MLWFGQTDNDYGQATKTPGKVQRNMIALVFEMLTRLLHESPFLNSMMQTFWGTHLLTLMNI